jgi:hypothetical protein
MSIRSDGAFQAMLRSLGFYPKCDGKSIERHVLSYVLT